MKITMRKTTILAIIALLMGSAAQAQECGLERHDFMYAGQSKNPRMFIVKDGQVQWEYNNRGRRGEISDAILLTDGHLLLAHQYGIMEITQEKEVVWQYDAPEGTEIHTLQPIGRHHVVFVQNGAPALVRVMEIPSCQVVQEFEIPASKGIHGQFRNARLSTRGTLLVAHMGMGYIAEYSAQGNELCRWDLPGAWSVTELEKEHLLAVGKGGLVKEMLRDGTTVREVHTTDYGFRSAQKAVKLKDGHWLINNWWNEWDKVPLDTLNAPLQAVEIDADGKVVWQLSSWKDPDLGPATTIQPLEQAVNRDRLFFGDYNGRSPKLCKGVNEPLGEGKGLHPGRVAWVHAPGVASWDGRSGLWMEDRWNDQTKADAMMAEALCTVAGQSTAAKAWKALFRNFNSTHDRGRKGYRKGESIAIKLNMNNALTHRDTVELNSSPFVTLALVRSLVRDGRVRQQDIVVCEPSRAITDSIYDKIHREFPRVRFVDNIGGDGREKCEYYPKQILYSHDNENMAQGLAKCIVDATYLINSALLKTHAGPGVTLTSKNWYGATDIYLQWRKNSHIGFSPDKRNGVPAYKTFVDFIGHKDLGGKTLLFLIDGTYGSRDVNGQPAPKWQKAPFNNDWACSLIASQDGVACDAVAMDLLMSEWPEFGSFNYCDEYLLEAATLPHPRSGTVYDPERDGTPLTAPLGLFEHGDKQHRYTKIDLQYKEIQ